MGVASHRVCKWCRACSAADSRCMLVSPGCSGLDDRLHAPLRSDSTSNPAGGAEKIHAGAGSGEIHATIVDRRAPEKSIICDTHPAGWRPQLAAFTRRPQKRFSRARPARRPGESCARTPRRFRCPAAPIVRRAIAARAKKRLIFIVSYSLSSKLVIGFGRHAAFHIFHCSDPR